MFGLRENMTRKKAHSYKLCFYTEFQNCKLSTDDMHKSWHDYHINVTGQLISAQMV